MMKHSTSIAYKLRTIALEGNLADPSTKKTEIPDIDSPLEEASENSKFVYLNDSYELDEIPLDVETIIDMNDNEQTI